MTDEHLFELILLPLHNPANYRPVKDSICIYIDVYILEWYKFYI